MKIYEAGGVGMHCNPFRQRIVIKFIQCYNVYVHGILIPYDLIEFLKRKVIY